MKQLIRGASNSEHGQSIVLIALAMLAILAMTGLVLDGGQIYFFRRDSQNSSDAAALAGTRVLTKLVPGSDSDAQVWTAVSQYATANHVSNPSTNLQAFFIAANYPSGNTQPITGSAQTIPSWATGVAASTTINVQVGFISLVSGVTQYPVSTVAAAQAGPPSGASNLMPMTVCISPYTGCQFPPYLQYPNLTYLAGDGSSAGSGQFAWLTFGLTNADCGGVGGVNIVYGLMKIPASCTSPYVPLPSWVNSSTGIHPNTNIQGAAEQWLNLPFGQALWTIPLYDDFTGTGSNGKYHIVKFAEMIPAGYYFAQNQCYPNSFCYDPVGNPNPCGPDNPGKNAKCVGAWFIDYVKQATGGTPGVCNTGSGFNVCAIWLVQ